MIIHKRKFTSGHLVSRRRKVFHLWMVIIQLFSIVGSGLVAVVQPRLPEPLAALQS